MNYVKQWILNNGTLSSSLFSGKMAGDALKVALLGILLQLVSTKASTGPSNGVLVDQNLGERSNSDCRLHGEMSSRCGNLLISQHQPPIRWHQADRCEVDIYNILSQIYQSNTLRQTKYCQQQTCVSSSLFRRNNIENRVERVESGLPTGCLSS